MLKNMLMYLLGFIFAGSIIIFIALGAFNFYRWFNWKYGYESYTRDTILEMVNPECLKKSK